MKAQRTRNKMNNNSYENNDPLDSFDPGPIVAFGMLIIMTVGLSFASWATAKEGVGKTEQSEEIITLNGKRYKLID
jgi:hypothetical protein